MRNICLIALYLICFQAYSQQTIEPDTMKILDWQFFFKSNFKIDSSEEGVVLRYFKNKGFGEKFFPNRLVAK